MGMIHCIQTDHSLALELFQDATQTVRTAACLESNSRKEWKKRSGNCAKMCVIDGITFL